MEAIRCEGCPYSLTSYCPTRTRGECESDSNEAYDNPFNWQERLNQECEGEFDDLAASIGGR